MANSGADYLYFLGADSANSSMALAMHNTGYELKTAEYFTAYATNFIELAQSGAEGATAWLFALPNEDGGANPEQARYLKWMGQTAPDTRLDLFASEAWVSAKAFFDALEGLPGPIDQGGADRPAQDVHVLRRWTGSTGGSTSAGR